MTTVHVYNALRRSLSDFPEIPVLDDFCQMFINDAFRGQLPERNFVSIFRRALYNSKISKHGLGQTSSSRLQIGVLRKLDQKRVYPWLVDQHFGHHALSDEFMDKLHKTAPRFRGEKKHRTIVELCEKASVSEFLEKAKAAVLPEIKGLYPLARFNFLKAFMFCAEFLEEFGGLSRKTLRMDEVADPEHRKQVKHKVVVARFAAEVPLDTVDEHSQSRQAKRRLAQMALTRHAKQAFEKLDRGATLSRFLWDI